MGHSMPDFDLLGVWQESHAHPKLLSCACVDLPHKLNLLQISQIRWFESPHWHGEFLDFAIFDGCGHP